MRLRIAPDTAYARLEADRAVTDSDLPGPPAGPESNLLRYRVFIMLRELDAAASLIARRSCRPTPRTGRAL